MKIENSIHYVDTNLPIEGVNLLLITQDVYNFVMIYCLVRIEKTKFLFYPS